MSIDGVPGTTTLVGDGLSQLNVLQPTYVGGVPDTTAVSEEVGGVTSFTGCIGKNRQESVLRSLSNNAEQNKQECILFSILSLDRSEHNTLSFFMSLQIKN